MIRAGLTALLVATAGCAAPVVDEPFPGSPTAEISWRPWGPKAFAKAAAEDKLVLLSVGASWCHWCHVMDERTYGDPIVARLLATHFVAIRADADADPDLAARYRRWGWPATAILTPDARPVLERRGYVPSGRFTDLLRSLIERRKRGEDVARSQDSAPPSAPPPAPALGRVQALLDARYDPAQHGWGRGKQKYPWPAPIEHAFLRAWRRPADSLWKTRALATLEQTLKLADPVWGGIYQYSDDGTWGSPHYEKIASIQAGALTTFAQAYRFTADPRWLSAALEVHRYLKTFWLDDGESFASSQDAEPPARAKGAGGPGSGRAYFALDDAGRRAWGVPRVDRSVYANTNGDLIQGLCELYRASGDDRHRTDAVVAARALQRRLVREVPLGLTIPGTTPRDSHWALRHSADHGRTVYLDDQAQAGRAFLAVYGVSGDSAWLDAAQATARGLIVELEDLDAGGFFSRSLDPGAVGVFAERRRPYVENARAARFLLELSAVSGEDGWRAAATRALAVLDQPAAIKAQGRILGEALLAFDLIADAPPTLTVVGASDDPRTAALLKAAARYPLPGALLKRVDPGDGFPDRGRPTVYVCAQQACSRPAESPQALDRIAREFLGRDPRPSTGPKTPRPPDDE